MDIVEKKIKKFTDHKDESIRLSSIRRDAALFTASRLGSFKQASQKDFIEELEYWLNYFSFEVYKSPEALKEEHYQRVRASEHKAPLDHIDLTEEEIKD